MGLSLPFGYWKTIAAGGGVDLTDSLAHWYDLDESSGDAIDSHGTADGTDTSTVGTGTGNAPDGGNSRQPSSSDHFEASVTLATATSIGIWFNIGAAGDYLVAFSRTSDSSYFNAWWVGGTPDVGVRVSNKSGTAFTSGLNDITTPGWHSMVITMDGSSEAAYLDGSGSAIGSGTTGLDAGAGTLYIGSSQAGTAEFEGSLTSMGVWDKVLSAAEISAFHNSGTNLRYADL